MNTIKILLITCMLVIVSGCTSYSAGELRDSYSPFVVYGQESNDKVATVKAASGLTIWSIDHVRKVSAVKKYFGGGLDSVLLPEGKHTLKAAKSGVNLNISTFYYVSGHEYFIDYVYKKSGGSKRVYYWVKDLTEDKVVLGKEITIDELKK